MRKIFRAPDYAPIVAMRGGIGLGTMKSRVMRDRLQYLKRKKEGHSIEPQRQRLRERTEMGRSFLLGGSGGNTEKICAFVFTISLFISS